MNEEDDKPVDLSSRLGLGKIDLHLCDESGYEERVVCVKVETVGDVLMAIYQFYTASRKVFQDFEKFEEEQEVHGGGQFRDFCTEHIREAAWRLESWGLTDHFWFEGLVYLGGNRWRIELGS